MIYEGEEDVFVQTMSGESEILFLAEKMRMIWMS